jgi:dsRNA-specific ribonuclease
LADDSIGPTTVNSVEKGQGTGPSKQIAKEEAAKAAFYAMNF